MAGSKPDPTLDPYRDKLSVPLVVGVTGHVDIEVTDGVRKKLDQFWDTVRKLAAGDTPVVFLTSIAAGADHLATSACRDHGVPYCVVLPFAEEEYRKDFSGQALTDFEEDLRGAGDRVITCDARPGDYAAASDHIRKRCDILLAMWDGWETLDGKPGDPYREPEKGGTYYQIRTALGMDDLLQPHSETRHLTVDIPVQRSRKGPAYHEAHGEVREFSGEDGLPILHYDHYTEEHEIGSSVDFRKWADDFLANEKAKDIGPFEKFKRHLLRFVKGDRKAEKSSAKDFADVLRFIRGQNEKANDAKRIENSYFRGAFGKGAEKALSIVDEDLVRHEYFDRIATNYQTDHKRQFFRIGMLSILIGILGQAWGGLIFHSSDDVHEWIMHGVIFSYLAGCAAVFLYDKMIDRDDHYSKYVRPRTTAELLRLKVVWKLVGMPGSFADILLEEKPNSGSVLCLCNWEVTEKPLSKADRAWIEAGNGIEIVKACWLEDQKKFYRKYFGYERLNSKVTFCKNFIFGLGFVFAAILVLVFVAARIRGFDQREWFCLVWYREFIVGICPFLVASLGWLLEKNKWSSIAAQYRKTRKLFKRTIKYVNEDHPVESKRAIMKELVMFAHEENAEWNSIRDEAKPDPMW